MGSLSATYASLTKAWKWSSKDYTLHVLPLHHIHGVQNILNTALFNGAGVEFAPFDAGFCLKRLCSGDVTCFHAVPTIYVKFTQHLERLSREGQELGAIYRIMGRSSVDIIKSGGYKISALEIESVLLQHEQIKECAVVGKPDATWGEKVTAICVLTEGELSVKQLRDWGKERMASYKVPQELEVVSALPRNQMGKLEKKKILERYAQ